MYHNLIRSYIPFQQANNNKLLYIYLLLYTCIFNSKYLLSQDSNYVELFSSSGILSSEGLLINNLPQGEWISYHSNGNLKSKGSWKNNKLIGTWSFYNFNGLLIKKEEYKNNLKVLESDIYESDIAEADEIWCSSSTNEVVPIVKLDGNMIKDGKVGPVTTEVYTIAQDFIMNF